MSPFRDLRQNWKFKISLVFVFALGLRLLYLTFVVQPHDLLLEDQGMYVKMADQLAAGEWAEITPDRVLGYPIFLFLIQKAGGNIYPAALVIQCMADSFTCVLIGVLAQAAFGQGFLLAGLLTAFNLNMIILSAMILTDSLALFFFASFLVGMALYFRSGNTGWAMLCLGFLAVATAVRPTTYFLYPVMVLALAGTAIVTRKTPGQSVGIALAGIFFWALFMGPQHWRNWVQYNYAGYVSQGGVHLVGWVVPGVYQYGGLGSYREGEVYAQNKVEQFLQRDNLTELPLDESKKQGYLVAAGKECLREMGWPRAVRAWITGSAVNLLAPSIAFAPRFRELKPGSFYYTPGKNFIEKLVNYARSGASIFYLSCLAIGTLFSAVWLFLGAAGFFRMLRQAQSYTVYGFCLSLLVIIGYFLGVTGPVIGTKYMLPLEPLILILALNGAKELGSIFKKNTTKLTS